MKAHFGTLHFTKVNNSAYRLLRWSNEVNTVGVIIEVITMD